MWQYSTVTNNLLFFVGNVNKLTPNVFFLCMDIWQERLPAKIRCIWKCLWSANYSKSWVWWRLCWWGRFRRANSRCSYYRRCTSVIIDQSFAVVLPRPTRSLLDARSVWIAVGVPPFFGQSKITSVWPIANTEGTAASSLKWVAATSLLKRIARSQDSWHDECSEWLTCRVFHAVRRLDNWGFVRELYYEV